jgi:hypothetical protein
MNPSRVFMNAVSAIKIVARSKDYPRFDSEKLPEQKEGQAKLWSLVGRRTPHCF